MISNYRVKNGTVQPVNAASRVKALKVSLITTTLNSEQVIASNLASVKSQVGNFQLEHVIQDGGSTDDTLKILSDYKKSVSYPVILETGRDRGFYDAVNKGIERSSGEVVGLLNSDDWLASETVLADLAHLFDDDSQLNVVYGDLDYVKPIPPTPGSHDAKLIKVVRRWRSSKYAPGKIRRGWMPPHPTVYVRRTVFDQTGPYRLDLGSAGDYEWLLRLFLGVNQACRTVQPQDNRAILHIPKVLVNMQVVGQSNASVKNRLAANRMDRQAWTVNQLKPSPFFRLLKPLRKIGQWF